MKKKNRITTILCIVAMIFSMVAPVISTANAKDNLLTFEDFENGLSTTNASGTVTNEDHHSGNYSLKYDNSDAGGHAGWNVEVTTTTPSAVNVSNYDYVDFWLKDVGNNNVAVKLIDSNGNSSEVWTDAKSTPGEWTEFKVDLNKYDFSTVDRSSISTVAFYEWNKGVYYIDDIKFIKNSVPELNVASDYDNGTYSTPINLTLSASKDGSDIYYTTDNTNPTTSSKKYSAPITVDKSMNIKAIAVNGNETSSVAIYNYVIESVNDDELLYQDFETGSANTNGSGMVTTSEFNSGSYSLKYDKTGSHSGWDVQITTSSAVNISSYDYVEFWIKDTGSNTVEVKLIDSANKTASQYSNNAPVAGGNSASVAGKWTKIKVDLSKFTGIDKTNINKVGFYEWDDGTYYIDDIKFCKNPLTASSDKESGTYESAFNVVLSANKADSNIYYTTDGTEPTTSSTQYTAPIVVDKNMTLKAIAAKDGQISVVAAYNYVINSSVNNSPTWFQTFEGDDAATKAFTAAQSNTKAELSNIANADETGKSGLVYSVTSSGSPEKDTGSVVINSMNGPIDTRSLNYLIFYFKDTQGSNTMKVSLIDADGNETDFAGSGWTDLKTAKNEWKQYFVPLSGRKGTVDRSRITGIRIGEWNSGKYYIDNVYFADYLYTGTPNSGIQAISVNDGEVKSTLKEDSYYVSQSAELIAKDGYDIYYTTDGTDPTTASTKYITPLSISESTEVKAIAVKNGTAGTVYTFHYKIIPYEVKGDHSPGTYIDSVVVEFRSKNSNDKIYYTTDGSEPTTASTPFIKPMFLKDSTTFKVRAYSPDGEAGNVSELAYVINKSGNVVAPKVSVPEGTYGKEFQVALTSESQDAAIYYTLDGSTPSSNSNKYQGPINITSDIVLKAIAVAGGKSSQVTTKQYKFNRVNTPFLKANGKAYKTNYGLGDTVILRGTNAGGWLLPENWQCPTNAADLLQEKRVLTERFGAAEAERLIRLYENNWWTEEDFDKIKAEDINMIRLPISYFEMLNDDGSLRNDAFERLDWFVSECAKRGIYVQIDMHGAVGSQNGKDHSGDTTIADVGNFYGNEANIQKTIKLWETIAERFKENPWVCGYDLLNEPSAVGTIQFETYDRIYKAIRAIDKDHIIYMQAIWEPQHLPNPSYYNWENISYEYHFYGWDVEKDAEGQKAFIQNKIKFVNEYTNYGVPVLVGEFSFFSNTQSWLNGLDLFESQGWSYTNWTYKVTGEGSSWGLYTAKNNPVDINNDSIETIESKWGKTLNTSAFTRNDKFADIMKAYFNKNHDYVGVKSIALNKDSINLKVNEMETITAIVAPTNSTYKDLIWSSDNKNVATVENGVVKAVGLGTTTITAKNVGGLTAVCTVTVSGNSGTANDRKSSSDSNNSILNQIPVVDNTLSKKDGWNKEGNNWIYIKNGQTVAGWIQDTDKKWYYMDSTGIMKTGWLKDADGKWYYLNNSGAMQTGWLNDTNGKWYYMDNSGSMKIGWLKDTDGKWYCLDNDGAMKTGWHKDVDGKWYYLGGNGVMQTGWQLIAGVWYFMYDNGSMASNTAIGEYALGSSGALIE
jgi:glucan-binding YG repeat protein